MATVSLKPDLISQAIHAELAVVMPIYNEAESIRTVVAEWLPVLRQNAGSFQMILLNDGSRDATWEILTALEAEHPECLVVVDKWNSGHGRSCRLGYDGAVLADSVKWILQIDSDGQCDPAYFERFWREKDSVDCVFGIRVRRDDGALRALTSQICRWGSTLLSGVDLVDPNVPYRLIRKAALAGALTRIPASFDLANVALTALLKRNPDLRWSYVPIRFRERQGGVNSINLFNVAHLGVSMLFDLARLKK